MTISKILRNLHRGQEILTVLFRHGFGDLLERTGLTSYLKSLAAKEELEDDVSKRLKTTPRRFRETLEEVGGAFVKLGQLLSTRPDLLPPDWIEELARLQDEVPPIDFELIRKTIEEELGPIEQRFLQIDPVPLATASVAQVHAGLALNGNRVVVKVRKPGIKAALLQDCDILEAFAELLEKHVEESRNYRPVQIVQEFRAAVTGELDFSLEGQNLDRFRSDFQSYPLVVFPAVYWDQTTERVLTMERMEGIKISDIEALRDSGVDNSRVAHNLAEAIVRQVLEFGFFHCDPHPGNVLVIPRDTVCFLDCGMVGRLDEMMRENLLLLVSAGIRKDTEMIADILTDMNALPEDIDRRRFLRDSDLLLERYYRLPLKRIKLDLLVNDLVRLVRTFGIQVPSDLLLVGKALVTLEGVGRTLDPNFQAVAVAKPFVREIVVTTYSPIFLARRLMQGAYDLARFLRDLPSDLRELSHQLRESRFKIVLDHSGLNESLREVERATNRLSTSIIMAALILASAVVAVSALEPRVLGVPVLGIAGFGFAAALGLWLVITARFGKGS
ncbi:MAG: AarF/ABC1/UbiB kinase family protein [Desulfomonile tiedjei]|nr:AarF/ABC1/UbiB kinase family protein [Desulfomonile tiedjei]